MNIDEATDFLSGLLHEAHVATGGTPTTTVTILRWEEDTQGFRVAEVAYTDGNAGGVFMQSDLPYGLAVCAQTERALIALVTEDAYDDGEYRDVASLVYLLTDGKYDTGPDLKLADLIHAPEEPEA